MLKVSTALVLILSLGSLSGCNTGVHAKAETVTVPVENDPYTAIFTNMGTLCLTYGFADEDKTISSLHGLSDDEKRKTLAGLPTEEKERILHRLSMPKNLPLCADLAHNLAQR